ncbi:hypothetical protein C8R43DRAFT_873599, partial [Mycena crocata]
CIYDPPQVDAVKYAHSKGHQIASHTWSHKVITPITSWRFIMPTAPRTSPKLMMQRASLALQRLIGVTPAFLRPPYGAYNTKVQAAAIKFKKTLVTWDFDSGDTVGVNSTTTKQEYAAAEKMHSTLLALNHETASAFITDVIPYAIQLYSAAGFKLVTVAECLGMQPYNAVTGPANVLVLPEYPNHC